MRDDTMSIVQRRSVVVCFTHHRRVTKRAGWGMYSYNRRFGVPSWIYLGYFALLTVVTIIPLLEAIAEQFSVFAKKTHRVPLSA